jgi:branched-chain amino acid transport system ATP-binding protein
MTVLENVMVGRHARTKAGFFSGVLNLPWTWKEEREIRERSMELLGVLGMADSAGQIASNLPFGKQRLLEIARALATEPSLLLLDEPAAGLNIYETRAMADLVLQIRGWGITVLLVEHDMSLVMDISDEIVVLNYGRKVAEGQPAAIQRDPEVIRIYLGGDHA